MGRAEVLLAGIGNRQRGDDGVGSAIIAALRGQLPAGVQTLTGLRDPARLLEALTGVQAAWLVDASVGGGAPGTLTRLDLADTALPRLDPVAASTHGFGLAATLELARALGRLPGCCVVYAVEAAGFDHGAPLSAPVRAAVPAIARRLLDEIEQQLAARRNPRDA